MRTVTAICLLCLCTNALGAVYTHSDDFSTDTTSNYEFTYYPTQGSMGATCQLMYEAINSRVVLYANGGYGWTLMRDKSASPIPTTDNFQFSCDLFVLQVQDNVGALYLGDLYSSVPYNLSPSSRGITFALDTSAQSFYVQQWDGALCPVLSRVAYGSNNVTLKIERYEGLYKFYANNNLFWESTLDFLNGVSLYYGAQNHIGSGPRGYISETAVDNWNFSSVPEPATLFLLTLGGLALRRRK
jgi:hypothetical protein